MLAQLPVLLLFAGALAQKEPNYAPNRTTMVHLFEWTWQDIARECENFLGPKGFAGVQVSPIQENVIVKGRPWWERYQSLSYQIVSRSGSEAEFRDMVARCNRAGVRIYVDVLMNHMTGDHANATGVAGSTAQTEEREYPAVPYRLEHFHEACAIQSWQDPWQIRNCELVGLHDLDQSHPFVRRQLIDFLNRIIDIGVAGYRVDAAKHMSPKDLQYIYAHTKPLNTSHGFKNGSRAFIFQEVIDNGNEGVTKYEYNSFGTVTEFRYGNELSNVLLGRNDLKWLMSWGEAWGLLPTSDALVFVDNHDTQRNSGDVPLTYKKSRLYKMAVAFMLAHPYGWPRVMSSFDFDSFAQGPPANGTGAIVSPGIRGDATCSNGWICEHRWRQIYNMVAFRNVVAGTKIEHWWDNEANQIAFARGNRGFIALNGQRGVDLKRTLKTNLPAGYYCDVISGEVKNGRCTGKFIRVNHKGMARVEIRTSDEDGVVAFHVGAKLA